MFNTFEHKFNTSEHKFNTFEHKFNTSEHNFPIGIKTNTPRRKDSFSLEYSKSCAKREVYPP